MRKLLAIIFAAIAVTAGCSRDGDGSRKRPEKPSDTIHADTAHTDTTHADTTRTDTTSVDTTRNDTIRTDTARTDTARVDTTSRQVDSLVGRHFDTGYISYKVKSSSVVHVTWFEEVPDGNTLTIPPTVSWKDREFRVTAVEFNGSVNDFRPGEFVEHCAYCNSNLVLSEGVDSILYMFPVSGTSDIWLPRTFKFFAFYAFNAYDAVTVGGFLDSVRIHIPSMKDWLAIGLGTSGSIYNVTPTWGNHRLCIGDNSQPVTDIEIPAGVSRISEPAFAGNVSVRSVRVSDGVTSIGRGAFALCPELRSVVLPAGLEEISENLFVHCEKLSKVTLPRNLRKIRSGAFYGCNSLRSITLPASVEAIEPRAFSECYNLKEVYCLSKTPPHIEDYSFYKLDYLYVPRESVDLYKADKAWAKVAKNILPMEEARQGSAGKRR